MTALKKTMEKLRNRIETALQNKGPAPFFSLETLLLALSFGYGAVMRLRARMYKTGWLRSRSLPCRVISIGNITTGGTGKTPMTIFIAQYLRDMGYGVAVISRGYRGKLEDRGGIVSDGDSILVGPEQAGDEPYLMAKVLRGVPVLVGRRRHEVGRLAVIRFQPDVIILDDAFQHIRLKRDLNIVLLDSRLPYGNGYLLPRGVMREFPVALKRAHAVIYTRCSRNDDSCHARSLATHRPVFHSCHRPVIRNVERDKDGFFSNTEPFSTLKGKRAICFAGLADNQQFFETLRQAGCRLINTVAFSDHHRYSRFDMDGIAAEAVQKNADLVVTTFKDGVKLEASFSWPVPLVVVDVQIEFIGNENHFLDLLAITLPLPSSGSY